MSKDQYQYQKLVEAIKLNKTGQLWNIRTAGGRIIDNGMFGQIRIAFKQNLAGTVFKQKPAGTVFEQKPIGTVF